MKTSQKVQVVRTVTEQLGAEFAALTPEQWETPSACGDWTVAELCAHLSGGALMYAGHIGRGLAGDAEPPAGGGFATNRLEAAAGIKQRTRERRVELGEQVLDAYGENGQALLTLFEGASQADWQRPVFHPCGIVTVEQMLGWRLAELSLHRWDILKALGREANLPEDSYEALLEWLPIWLRAGFEPREPLPEPVRYQFVLSPPLLRTLEFRIKGASFDIDPDHDDVDADAVLTTHRETFILLMMGRLSWSEALADKAVLVGGSRAAAAEIPRWFGCL